MKTLAKAAAEYAARGWYLLPCRPRDKDPLIPKGFQAASNDVAQIAEWWRRWPDANIGAVPGLSGLLVLDVDGVEGEKVAAEMGLLSDPTLEAMTGRIGGRHRWYRHPGGRIGNSRLGRCLDVRADAGYVLLPPSVHPNGQTYRWVYPLDEISPLPAKVADRLQAIVHPRQERLGDLERIVIGSRDQTLTRLAGALRHVGAPPGMIHTALRAINLDYVDPPLASSDIGRIARSVARYAPSASELVHDVTPRLRRSKPDLRRTR